MNSQTNDKSSGNDTFTVDFYKHFSNEVAPFLLDVFTFCGKLGTMGVTSRIGIIPVISVTSGDIFFHIIKVAFTKIQYKIKTNGLDTRDSPVVSTLNSVMHYCTWTCWFHWSGLN